MSLDEVAIELRLAADALKMASGRMSTARVTLGEAIDVAYTAVEAAQAARELILRGYGNMEHLPQALRLTDDMISNIRDGIAAASQADDRWAFARNDADTAADRVHTKILKIMNTA